MPYLQLGDKKKKVKAGDSFIDEAKELGVPFSCEDGSCCTCMIDIEDGEELLNELTEAERSYHFDRKTRLACQCKVKENAKDDSEISIRF